MALMNCPECKKQVSERAYTCPFCGFPISDYLEELKDEKKAEEERIKQEELEKKKQEEICLRKNEYLKKQVFTFSNNTFSYDQNEKICAIIGDGFISLRDSLHTDLYSMIVNDNAYKPSDFEPNNFGDYAKKMLSSIFDPYYNLSIELCKQFGNDEDISLIQTKSKLIDIRSYFYDLHGIYQDAYKVYDINTVNAHSQYYDDYANASTMSQPIEKVYSSSLLGLVGANFSAKLINGVVEILTSSNVEKKQKVAKNRYVEELMKESLSLDLKVFERVDQYIDEFSDIWINYTLDVLLEKNQLFERYSYPREEIDMNEYVKKMSNDRILNSEKQALFIETLKNNPANMIVMGCALGHICFTTNEYHEIIRMVDFFGYQNELLEYFSLNNILAEGLFSADKNIDVYVEEATIQARSIGDRVFDSIEEKDQYIEDDRKYKETIFNIYGTTDWFKYETLQKKYEYLVEKGCPVTSDWQEIYNKNIDYIKSVLDEINNTFLKQFSDAISLLCEESNIATIYQIDVLKAKREELCNSYNELQKNLAEEEILIANVQIASNILLISSRFFYYVNSRSNKLLMKFHINDIERVYIKQSGFFSDRYFGIYITGRGEVSIPVNEVSSEDFESIKRFFNALIPIIKKNPIVGERTLLERCADTELKHLNKDFLDKQADRVVELYYILSSLDWLDKKNLVLKWTYEITMQDTQWGYLWQIIRDTHIGVEYILVYDEYRVITDQAIYIANTRVVASNYTCLTRYAFDDYVEVIPGKQCGKHYGATNNILFLENNNEISDIVIDENYREFEAALLAVASSRAVRMNTVSLLNKKFVYCRKCKKILYSTTEGICECPNCGSDLNYNGLTQRFSEGGYLNNLAGLDLDKRKSIRSKICFDVDIIWGTIKTTIEKMEQQEREKIAKEKEKIAKEKEERERKKRQIIEGLKRSEIHFLENKRYDYFEKSYIFRKRFKALMGEKYVAIGYDFLPESINVLSAKAKLIYQKNGDYILYQKDISNTSIIITDRVIYIEDLIIEIRQLQEVICFSQIWGVEKYALGFFYLSGDYTFITLTKSDEIKFLASGLSAVLKEVQKKDYNAIGDTGGFEGYCAKCNGRHVKEGILKSKCEDCGNTDASYMYRNRGRKEDITEKKNIIAKNFELCKQREKFTDEEEWLKWAKDVISRNEHKIKDDEKKSSVSAEHTDTAKQNEEVKTMFCPYCGQKISRAFKFCNYCGEKNPYGGKVSS